MKSLESAFLLCKQYLNRFVSKKTIHAIVPFPIVGGLLESRRTLQPPVLTILIVIMLAPVSLHAESTNAVATASTTNSILAGKDLMAWKLARIQAEKFVNGNNHIMYDNAMKFVGRMDTKDLYVPVKVLADPSPSNMVKTVTGDYVFTFATSDAKSLLVEVTDLGTQLRAGHAHPPGYQSQP